MEYGKGGWVLLKTCLRDNIFVVQNHHDQSLTKQLPNLWRCQVKMYNPSCFAEKPAERENSRSKSDVQSSSGQTLLQDSGKAVPEIPEGMEDRKGRYWNYEHNRWSYCEGTFINFISKFLLDNYF